MKNRKLFLATHALHVIGVGMETASHALSDEKDLKKDLRLAGSIVGLVAAVLELGAIFSQKNTDDNPHKIAAAIKAAVALVKCCISIVEYNTKEHTHAGKTSADNLRDVHKALTFAHGLFAVGHGVCDIAAQISSKAQHHRIEETAAYGNGQGQAIVYR